ncbi:peptidoglycan DD-metalloendopeptidase family protein [Rhodobacter sp. ETT8]|uniref:Peptidoglycan DD-metalloendopeptidase family protein n=1 Tax=Pseudotabrizicola algicola TaxID=2709381 RepID=A0A6B3RQY5_9RHOB|nr:M23 family metallopeptidase [Pseudotabrizicola algicola]NEX47208.1 peptidoglycan DD-metalloendopeptidase family protein [Pseudotabrizicola algicola]
MPSGGGSPFEGLDWDLRNGPGVLATSEAALNATERRPEPDSRGVISYPGYQVAVARRGDTAASVAARVGINTDELARYNAIIPTDPLREGEILALPRRIADTGPVQGGGILPTGSPSVGASPAPVDVSTIATTALDRVGTPTPPATTRPSTGGEPVRHQVRRGETAFSIARSYNISAKSLGEWNGLGPNLDVREGQYLIIPVASSAPPPSAPAPQPVSQPGTGSPTPTPPSAAKPLPAERTTPAATAPRETPASPDLGAQRSTSTKMLMPVQGSIIRPYSKGRNDGIDISAPAGTAVKAAADGTVAAITTDTAQTPIIVVRHADNILTVYAGVDGISVKKGDRVSRGQTIAAVRAGTPSFLHFEVRRGADSTDPVPFLQ